MNQPNQNGAPPCGCGRSPTGYCIGWHNMTLETYQKKLNEWNQAEQKQLLREDNK